LPLAEKNSFAVSNPKMETTGTIKWRRSTPEPLQRVFNVYPIVVQSKLECSKAPWWGEGELKAFMTEIIANSDVNNQVALRRQIMTYKYQPQMMSQRKSTIRYSPGNN